MKTWLKRIISLSLAVFLFCTPSATAFAAQGDVSLMTFEICEHPKTPKQEWQKYTTDEKGHSRIKVEFQWCEICQRGYFPYPIDSEGGPHEYDEHLTYGSSHTAANPENHYIMWIETCLICKYKKVTRQPAGCTKYGCVDLMSLEPESHAH